MENQEVGRVPVEPGSHPAGHAGSAVDGASRVDPSRYRKERYDAISTRILCADTPERPGWVVALIEQLSNGRWVINVGDQRYTNRTFAGVNAAFKWWQNHHSDCDSDGSPKGGDARGSVHDSAGIAQNLPSEPTS